jgi:hypothetical protein
LLGTSPNIRQAWLREKGSGFNRPLRYPPLNVARHRSSRGDLWTFRDVRYSRMSGLPGKGFPTSKFDPFRKSATFYNSVLRYESAREDGVPRPAYAPSRASLISKVMIAPVGGQLADIVPPS